MFTVILIYWIVFYMMTVLIACVCDCVRLLNIFCSVPSLDQYHPSRPHLRRVVRIVVTLSLCLFTNESICLIFSLFQTQLPNRFHSILNSSCEKIFVNHVVRLTWSWLKIRIIGRKSLTNKRNLRSPILNDSTVLRKWRTQLQYCVYVQCSISIKLFQLR